MKLDNEIEYILTPNSRRFVIYPIKHQNLWNFYKKAEENIWTAEEIDLSQDLVDWEKLNKNEQHFIKHVLAFFAASDGIVNENLCNRFAKEVQIPEARFFYRLQMAMEDIHSETYSLLIDTYIRDTEEKNKLFNAIETIPCVKQKADWALKHIESSNSFAERLLGFACVEGIFFSGSFCSIFWLKERGIMHGLGFSNELISKDESMHTNFAVELYGMLKNKLDEPTVHAIFKEAVEIEKNFVCDAIPVSLIGMNSDLMSQYIEYVADRLLAQLGYKKLWNTRMPFPFMELISMETKANFFEARVAEYGMAKVNKTQLENKVSFDADF